MAPSSACHLEEVLYSLVNGWRQAFGGEDDDACKATRVSKLSLVRHALLVIVRDAFRPVRSYFGRGK
jgi:hypothetical protein